MGSALAHPSVNPSLYILSLFGHALVSEDTSHVILEIITAFEGDLYKVVKIILSSKNLNYELRLRLFLTGKATSQVIIFEVLKLKKIQ